MRSSHTVLAAPLAALLGCSSTIGYDDVTKVPIDGGRDAASDGTLDDAPAAGDAAEGAAQDAGKDADAVIWCCTWQNPLANPPLCPNTIVTPCGSNGAGTLDVQCSTDGGSCVYNATTGNGPVSYPGTTSPCATCSGLIADGRCEGNGTLAFVSPVVSCPSPPFPAGGAVDLECACAGGRQCYPDGDAGVECH